MKHCVSVERFANDIKRLNVKLCQLKLDRWEIGFCYGTTLYLTVTVLKETCKAEYTLWDVKATDPAEEDTIAAIRLAENPRLIKIAEEICEFLGKFNNN